MSKSIVIELEDREAIADPVTDLLRTGAQQLIQRAVEAELSELLSQHGDRRTETGKLEWCATVICLNASCRPAWVR